MPEEINLPPSSIRLILADDHDILRQGLKLLLALQPGIEVIGEARTGLEAIEISKQLVPDVVVMDISMPELDGLAACREIRNKLHSTQVLILTMHESEEYFLQALRVGAAGYLVKKAAPADLHVAVQTIAHGGAYLYSGLAKALIRAYVTSSEVVPNVPQFQQTRPANSNLAQELQVLTPREIEVLKLVAEGYTNQAIADQLVISIKTVQAHRANVMEKLGLSDITQLVRFAIRHGMLPTEM